MNQILNYMNHTFLYDYVGLCKFCLNQPPFLLKLNISNFTNYDILKIEKNAVVFKNLPKNIDDILQTSTAFNDYIVNLSNNDFLHFTVELYNAVEKIHIEYFSIKLDKVNPIR
jgi:hypothetical protein